MKKQLLMTRVRKCFNGLLKNRAGQSTTEYILILAIVVMIASKLKAGLSSTIVDKGLNGLNQSMDSAFSNP